MVIQALNFGLYTDIIEMNHFRFEVSGFFGHKKTHAFKISQMLCSHNFLNESELSKKSETPNWIENFVFSKLSIIYIVCNFSLGSVFFLKRNRPKTGIETESGNRHSKRMLDLLLLTLFLSVDLIQCKSVCFSYT